MSHELRTIGFYTSGPGGSSSPHRVVDGHVLCELVTKGVVFDPLDGEIRKAGWLFVSRAGDDSIHRSPGRQHYECLAAHYAVSDEDLAVVTAWPRSFSWGKGAEAEEFAREVTHAFHHCGLERQLIGDMLWSHLRFRFAYVEASGHAPDIPPRVAAAMDYIEGNLGEEIDIDTLAGIAQLSTSHLHARFKQFVGKTPHQYLIDQRMRSARQLLATTIDPIKDVAAKVGFPSPEHFCRTFRRHCGRTAAEYRIRFSVNNVNLRGKDIP